MPLRDDRARRIRDRLSTRLPAEPLDVATAMGGAFTVYGYVNDRRGGLDALGQPERDAVVYLPPGQATLIPGHEINTRWAVWTDERTEDGWTAHDLRRLPAFSDWTRIARTLTGRDPDTDAPIYTDAPTTVSAYLIRATLGGEEAPGTITDTTRGALLLKGGTAALAVGDRVEHATHGQFRVTGLAPYGPWASATVEAV